MTWLLCDYGEVLSLPQPPEAVAAMSGVAGVPTERFRHLYWEHRQPYDRGDIGTAEYWGLVAGRPDERLVELDVASWLHLDPASLAAAHGSGMPLALLSNAPVEVAAAIDRLPALQAFEPRLFSCDLRRTKPEPEIYAAALSALGTDDVVFVDDRQANVEAARSLGIRAVHFTGPGSWAEVSRAAG